ncbi:hypothetical protein ACER0C_001974 [Sarotherodon galilaeus]
MSNHGDTSQLSQLEVRSECRSAASRRSNSSAASLAAARARAEAEAARARAEYAKCQIDMEVKKARMEAALNALKQEGEAEAALAAARVLEAAVLDQAESVKPPDVPVAVNNAHTTGPDISAAAARGYPPSSPPVWQPKLPPPHWSNHVGAATPQRQADVSDLAALLSRRDLLTSGLTVFDNKPETYLAWRSMFHNATEDLNLKCSEELDLLTKWLSGESLQHALRIRAVHVNNPETGFQRLWQRLDRIYGSSEVIEASLFRRLESFPRVTPRDNHLLQELADLLLELEAAKNEGYLPGLRFLDTPRGINPIVEKLPHTLQESWIKQGSKYEKEHRAHYPPFSYFVQFVNSNAEMKTDPSFILQNYSTGHMKIERPLVRQSYFRAPLTANKTQVGTPSNKSNTHSLDPDKQCPVHMKPHSLAKRRGFRMKTLDEQKSLLKGLSICYKCLSSTGHRAKDCKPDIHCLECNSDAHISAMHAGPPPWTSGSSDSTPEAHGGEPDILSSTVTTSNCTEVCGQGQQGRFCSKICMVKVYHSTAPQTKRKMYAILDDQSNVSLACSPFFDMFNVHGEAFPYTMKTCSGTTNKTGRRAHGFVIEGVDGKMSIPLPTLTECNQIPDNRSEIPTPEAAAAHHHLAHIAAQIPPLDPEADILLLLGRDVIQAHKHLDLGWVIVGDVCLSGAHRPTVNSYKTNILDNGRPSFLSPCGNRIYTKVKITGECPLFESTQVKDELGKHIFQQTTDDDKMALSAEDKSFLNIMHKEFAKDDANNWVAPLPFRHPRRRLPNNREQALTRLMSLWKTLKRKTKMKDHYVEFMKRIFDKGHAERAPPLKPHQECWYLPHFGVYHPQKPAKIRIVFDSSAQFENVSLNQVLCKGPDLNNSLVGVLLRFRGDPHAVMANVEQMFHNFMVREDHRDYLRFLWFRDHDLDGEVDEFHMTVHIFGNCPSPSVAIYGLKKTAVEGEKEYGRDVREFIERHFYTQAIDALHRTQRMLAQSNIRLHKISSNSPVVVSAFPSEDLATGPQELQRGQHAPLMQRSLGLGWDLSTDQLSFQVEISDRPFTKHGVLSVINSLYDPLGFAVPVSIEGRSILRAISMDISEWDAALPREKQDKWQQWKVSLKHLQQLKISRMYKSISLSESQRKEMHVFASTKAVGAVAYLKLTAGNGLSEVGFLLGKARLAPKPDITIPRLELCAAVLAVEVAEMVQQELDTTINEVNFVKGPKLRTRTQKFPFLASSFKYGDDLRPLRSPWTGQLLLSPVGKQALVQQVAEYIQAFAQLLFYCNNICMEQSESIRTQSPLSKLSPYIDADAVLRVGGRLARAQLSTDETHPMLIPSKHYITQLIIRHFHAQVCHQGRHFTEGAIRAAGFWIVGGKRAVSSVIFNCVICRRLRGNQQEQIMSDLPEDRMCTDPAFTCVGLDVFGPWPVTVRKTRGGQAEAKRWAVIYEHSCHTYRSDRSNGDFIFQLQIDKKGCHNDKINTYLGDRSCGWQFNPPHASHMAGSWERMIGVSRRILDVMLLKHGNAKLTHEVLVTFMAEVTAIVNSRPLTTLSADSEHPEILTPAMLLTQKVGAPPVPPAQWRRVQYLANVFWGRWRREYLSGLQGRRKWRAPKPNLQIGDAVLLKEGQENRIDWPLGLVTKTFPSQDGRVRKIEVKIISSGECRVYLRPIREVVLLVPNGVFTPNAIGASENAPNAPNLTRAHSHLNACPRKIRKCGRKLCQTGIFARWQLSS